MTNKTDNKANKTKKQMNKAEMKKAKGGANVSYMERKGKMLAPNTKSISNQQSNLNDDCVYHYARLTNDETAR